MGPQYSLLLIALTLMTAVISSTVSWRFGSPTLIEQSHPHEVLYQVREHDEDIHTPFSITCKAEGEPAPEYQWLKDGQPFQWNTSESGILKDADSGTITFTTPTSRDEGDYQCQALNKFGTASSNIFKVRRAFLGSFPKRSSEVRTVTATEGEPFKLSCAAPTGYPEVTNHWLQQSEEGQIRELHLNNTIVAADGGLYFTNLTQEHSFDGEYYYICAVSSLYLRMYKIGSPVILQVLPSDGPAKPVAPVAQYVSPSQVLALRGDELQLWCIFGGNPVPEVMWLKSGAPINLTASTNVSSAGLSILHAGKLLEISNVSSADKGVYSCTAKNVAGQSTHNFTVAVEATPYFTTVSRRKVLAKGEPFTLKCSAEGIPSPAIQWTLNGKSIRWSFKVNSKRLLLPNNGIFVLQATESDIGNYGCNASNRHGYVYQEIMIDVTYTRGAKITEKPQDVETSKGSNVTLQCRASGVPEPNITWQRNGRDVEWRWEYEPNKYTVSSEGYLSRLTIFNVQSYDSGQYQCQAKNKLPSVNCTCGYKYATDSAGAALKVPSDKTAVPGPPYRVGIWCTENGAVVNWRYDTHGASPIDRFVLEYTTDFAPDAWDGSITLPPRTTTDFVQGLSPWTNYTFRVFAGNRWGRSPPSLPSETCSTPPAQPWSNPQHVRLAAMPEHPADLLVTWQPLPKVAHNGPALEYLVSARVQGGGGAGDGVYRTELVPHPRAEVVLPGVLAAGHTVEVRVTARNRCGESMALPDAVTFSSD